MRNILFFTLNELDTSDGVSKKILYQKKALEKNENKVFLTHIQIRENLLSLYIDNERIITFRNKYLRAMKMLPLNQYILSFVEKNNIKCIYVRYSQFASPTTISLFKQLKKHGIKIVFEIPSYPYDKEGKILKQRVSLLWEKLWRKQLAKYVDSIVTYSNFNSIWNRPTIRIKNGIDFSEIPIKSTNRPITNQFVMIAVANIAFWHGFDRVIKGLNEYYKDNKNHHIKVKFLIVGKGEQYNYLTALVQEYKLNDYVLFCGKQYGKSLDELFESADIAIGCLGCHRKKIEDISSLKNVEYAARGIPFIYSERNSDFDLMSYIKKESPDESPINIAKLIEWRHNLKMQPNEIRNTIKSTLSWEQQMKIVSDYFTN